MQPRILVDTADVPGGGELRLFRRGSEFSIMLGANELMNSRTSGSEEALATLAFERMTVTPQPRVLIGGLGMGFTLRAALARLPARGGIVVAEVVPSVLDWARGPMADLYGSCLADPRVAVEIADVAELMTPRSGVWDAILLDVDNGPDGLTRPENDRLYGAAGLRAAHGALRPGGVLALWSAVEDRGFTARLRRAGFEVEEVVARASRGRGARHVIWLAKR